MISILKYLPVGTVCSVTSFDKLIVITGYCSVDYNNKFNVHDYEGYEFPEGSLGNNKIKFNHSDILSIKHIGYIDNTYNEFNELLLKQNIKNDIVQQDTPNLYGKVLFDEDGKVILEENDSNLSYDTINKLEFNDNGEVINR